MNKRGAFFPSSIGEMQMAAANSGFARAYTSLVSKFSRRKEDSAVADYSGRAATSVRSGVERQFTRMAEAHDRIRAELLARYTPHAR